MLLGKLAPACPDKGVTRVTYGGFGYPGVFGMYPYTKGYPFGKAYPFGKGFCW